MQPLSTRAEALGEMSCNLVYGSRFMWFPYLDSECVGKTWHFNNTICNNSVFQNTYVNIHNMFKDWCRKTYFIISTQLSVAHQFLYQFICRSGFYVTALNDFEGCTPCSFHSFLRRCHTLKLFAVKLHRQCHSVGRLLSSYMASVNY